MGLLRGNLRKDATPRTGNTRRSRLRSAIRFFVDVIGFELVEDTPSLTNDGRPKRWVVVRPVGGQTGLLLARADGDLQVSVAGQQFGGRVGLFLRVDDFEAPTNA